MLIPLTLFRWQLLRTALRAEAAGSPPPLGRELRVAPTRQSKDGTFLDAIVADGLLAVAGGAEPEAGRSTSPAPFRTRYKLTALGRHAAEFGEYERPHTPREAALRGVAAEIVADRVGSKTGRKKPKR